MSSENDWKSGKQRAEEKPSDDGEAGVEEERLDCRRLWKTLDERLAGVDSNASLYVAVRQSLHKVNRVSRGSLSPARSPRPAADRGGVSQESGVGRFAAIKALFDLNGGNEERTGTIRSEMGIMGRLARSLGWKRRDPLSLDLTLAQPSENRLDANDNVVAK
ncbi:uncharacterized protein LOC143371559 [Andrena cerasifolii]|uniref:uncharacterized protein LOC143371559 n=1 Tax=Andrena cerasifolii TaxID=2819439 RepID=UPI004037D16A